MCVCVLGIHNSSIEHSSNCLSGTGKSEMIKKYHCKILKHLQLVAQSAIFKKNPNICKYICTYVLKHKVCRIQKSFDSTDKENKAYPLLTRILIIILIVILLLYSHTGDFVQFQQRKLHRLFSEYNVQRNLKGKKKTIYD